MNLKLWRIGNSKIIPVNILLCKKLSEEEREELIKKLEEQFKDGEVDEYFDEDDDIYYNHL